MIIFNSLILLNFKIHFIKKLFSIININKSKIESFFQFIKLINNIPYLIHYFSFDG